MPLAQPTKNCRHAAAQPSDASIPNTQGHAHVAADQACGLVSRQRDAGDTQDGNRGLLPPHNKSRQDPLNRNKNSAQIADVLFGKPPPRGPHRSLGNSAQEIHKTPASGCCSPQGKPNWISFNEYALIGGGTRLKPSQYKHLISTLNRLSSIDPQLLNEDVLSTVSQYYKKTKLKPSIESVRQLDEHGRACAVGRRKTSTAKVWVVRGSGDVLVNSRPLNDYFVKIKDRRAIMYPLRVIDAVGKYNVFATAEGGGVTGQADAIMHALAKALVLFNPLLKTRLHRAGVLTRDYRHVERKKPGKKKARKMPTWVKR
ncbi:mitochondrial 37S ribosomal protein uS9m Ecym_5332 [Eremothecium cymbalariae DBVPG|uniref:Small ribosomal subunit protein uS9m n=1 Tax=Eremothecium cymbalariae (strain CBS 270.75 / DBVPG 7215 / KCTC 17166 / NRRL Y-17582) TaxID=931890 RepID=I6NDE9_ERECY|nr:hypothetical protein Ecym_5332 [Eremothecium cymbalariae DBVPG\